MKDEGLWGKGWFNWVWRNVKGKSEEDKMDFIEFRHSLSYASRNAIAGHLVKEKNRLDL